VAFKIKAAAFFAFPLVFVSQLLASVGSRVIYLDRDLFRSPLFGSHTLATSLGYAAFAYSMILGLMYLHLFRELKAKDLRRMYDRLPPLELLERMNRATLIAGFAFLTVGILLGSLLAVKVWGRLPLTDPKILLSGVLWLLYVAGMLLRRLFRWSGRQLSWFSVSGFAVVVAFMVTVRLLLPTLHRCGEAVPDLPGADHARLVVGAGQVAARKPGACWPPGPGHGGGRGGVEDRLAREGRITGGRAAPPRRAGGISACNAAAAAR
jgi:hypothetical protein